MKLLDDIITNATMSTVPITDLLRQCLVLAFKLKNETLKAWAESELNGYEYYGTIPDYRLGVGQAKGVFTGPFGMQLNDKPLPSYVLKKEHRHFANEVRLVQPIGAYEDVDRTKVGNLTWPADLVAMYQEKFIEGMALHSAWIEIPASMSIGMIDVVRTRILTFALEIQAQLPEETEQAVAALAPETVDRLVAVHIYGGNVSIGNGGVINANTIIAGDFQSLSNALKAIGVEDSEVLALQTSLQEDQADIPAGEEPKNLGARTLEWIGKTSMKAAKGGLKIGGDVATAVLTEWIKRQAGLGGP